MSTTIAPGAAAGSGAASAREQAAVALGSVPRPGNHVIVHLYEYGGIRWYPKWNHSMRMQMRSFSWS